MKIATVCSGIGSPELALDNLSKELGFGYENVFACEIDKFARASYNAIHSCGTMYQDMTKEQWDQPDQYADLFIGGIPCQAFSLAGKRLGEKDKRGVLFYDFYRYVKNQQPKVFIIENVKGLLSDNKGRTFKNWCSLLGQTLNYANNMFKHPDCLNYHLHYTVLNTKDFGLPQNRERVFLIGIRPDLGFDYEFPKGWPLEKRLKDVLEKEVDEKYYLSETALDYLSKPATGGYSDHLSFLNNENNDVAGCITANHSKGVPYNCMVVNEAKTLQGITITNTITNTIRTGGKGSLTDKHSWDVIIVPESTKQDVVEPINATYRHSFSNFNGYVDLSPTIKSSEGSGNQILLNNIRRLTPLECWRLQGFPDEAFYNAKNAGISDTQLYKQAGNSISVPVIRAIIRNILLILTK